MPCRRFWMMIRNIDRIEAAKSLTDLSVHFHAARGDTEGLSETLQQRVGVTVIQEVVMDVDSRAAELDRLRAMNSDRE